MRCGNTNDFVRMGGVRDSPYVCLETEFCKGSLSVGLQRRLVGCFEREGKNLALDWRM